MIYFESLKFANNLGHEYGLTLKLNDNQVHYLTSTKMEYLNQVYYLLKDKENYVDGHLFFDNFEVMNMDSSEYSNFGYENIAFFDDSLIIDQHTKLKNTVQIFYSFDTKKIEHSITELLEFFGFDENILNKKYKWLNDFDKWKFKLLLTLIKPSKYIVMEPIDYVVYRENIVKSMQLILDKIAKEFNRTILVFQQYNNLLAKEIVDLNNKKLFALNKRLTIINKKPQNVGFNLVKNKFNIYKYAWLYTWQIWATFSFFSIILTTTSIFMITLWSTNDSTVPQQFLHIVRMAKNNSVPWLLGAYFIYGLNIVILTLITILLFYKTRTYLNFLNTFNIRNSMISLTIPLLIVLVTLSITIIGFLINILIFQLKLMINESNIWWTSFYTGIAYFIYTFIVGSIFIVASNNKIKFKKLLLRIINENVN